MATVELVRKVKFCMLESTGFPDRLGKEHEEKRGARDDFNMFV